MSAIFIKDQTEFASLRASSPLLVVDCTATWCGPCKVIAPLMDQLSENYSDRAQVMKLDIDSNKPLAKEFGLKSIPAVLFFKQGELVETMIGVKTYDDYSQALDKHL